MSAVRCCINHQVLGNLQCRGQISEEPGQLLQELGHHTALGLRNCRFFCGRQNLDNIFQCIRQDNNKPHTTLILYGPPGCGMCKLSEQVQTAVGQDSVVTLLLRTSQLSSALHSLLRDICYQICLAFDLSPPLLQTNQACSDLVLILSKLLLSLPLRHTDTGAAPGLCGEFAVWRWGSQIPLTPIRVHGSTSSFPFPQQSLTL